MAKVNFWYEGPLDPSYSSASHTPSATVLGLMELGYKINHVAQAGFREREWMDCDLCVLYGMRHYGKRIIAEHERRGVPCVAVDLGYVKRAMRSNGYEGYWQVSKGGLNWLPKSAPSDRWQALNVPHPKPKNKKGYVLICEQTPNDASHAMDIDGLNSWMESAVSKCERAGVKYKKRRHPMNRMIDSCELPDCPIEEDLRGASAVYCHNSNVGNDALLAGIPVICDSDCEYDPTYKDLAHKEIKKDLEYPKNIEGYFHRLAYGQWTRKEIATGEAMNYVINAV